MNALAAWWSAWKWIVILLVLLAISVAGNLQQWRAKAVAKSEARAQTLADIVKVTAGIARDNLADARELAADVAIIAERGRTERVVYKTAAAKAPLAPNCAPGKARMDAVNAGADR
jgi:hypothetical protein